MPFIRFPPLHSIFLMPSGHPVKPLELFPLPGKDQNWVPVAFIFPPATFNPPK